MNVYIIVGIVGVISGILCAQADVPLAYSGRKNEKIDARSLGKPASWWCEVKEAWFDKAFWLSFLGQPGTYLTMWMLAERIGMKNPSLALILKINTFIGAYTGLFYHGSVCSKYIVYRRIAGRLPEEDALAAVEAVGKYAAVPSMISAVSLFLGTTAIMIIAILRQDLPVPKIMALLNPFTAALILIPLRKWNVKIGGAMGIGFSLFAIVLITAGCLL